MIDPGIHKHMMYICLERLRFYSYHGIHNEEKVLGNEYEVDIQVGILPRQVPVLHLEDTLDYTVLFETVKTRMDAPTPLLETIATTIATDLSRRYSEITRIYVSIKKLYPPINSFEGRAGVSFEWNRDQG